MFQEHGQLSVLGLKGIIININSIHYIGVILYIGIMENKMETTMVELYRDYCLIHS